MKIISKTPTNISTLHFVANIFTTIHLK